MLRKCISKIMNMVKVGYISLSPDDTQSRVVYNISSFGKQYRCYGVLPYGISCNPPDQTTQVVSWNVSGSDSNVVGVPTAPSIRFKDLKKGELKIGNFLTRSHIYFKSNSDVEIKSEEGTVTIFSPEKIILQVGTATCWRSQSKTSLGAVFCTNTRCHTSR